MRYLVLQYGKTRPSLVVDVVDVVDESSIGLLQNYLFDHRCPTGLIVDKDRAVILKDEFSVMDKSAIKTTDELKTKDLLSKLGDPAVGSVSNRVRRWLEGMSVDWSSFVPDGEALREALLLDVVPAAWGSVVRSSDERGL